MTAPTAASERVAAATPDIEADGGTRNDNGEEISGDCEDGSGKRVDEHSRVGGAGRSPTSFMTRSSGTADDVEDEAVTGDIDNACSDIDDGEGNANVSSDGEPGGVRANAVGDEDERGREGSEICEGTEQKFPGGEDDGKKRDVDVAAAADVDSSTGVDAEADVMDSGKTEGKGKYEGSEEGRHAELEDERDCDEGRAPGRGVETESCAVEQGSIADCNEAKSGLTVATATNRGTSQDHRAPHIVDPQIRPVSLPPDTLEQLQHPATPIATGKHHDCGSQKIDSGEHDGDGASVGDDVRHEGDTVDACADNQPLPLTTGTPEDDDGGGSGGACGDCTDGSSKRKSPRLSGSSPGNALDISPAWWKRASEEKERKGDEADGAAAVVAGTASPSSLPAAVMSNHGAAITPSGGISQEETHPSERTAATQSVASQSSMATVTEVPAAADGVAPKSPESPTNSRDGTKKDVQVDSAAAVTVAGDSDAESSEQQPQRTDDVNAKADATGLSSSVHDTDPQQLDNTALEQGVTAAATGPAAASPASGASASTAVVAATTIAIDTAQNPNPSVPVVKRGRGRPRLPPEVVEARRRKAEKAAAAAAGNAGPAATMTFSSRSKQAKATSSTASTSRAAAVSALPSSRSKQANGTSTKTSSGNAAV
ncbi:unnamed protein product, partial [Sphacelaria rigidula]